MDEDFVEIESEDFTPRATQESMSGGVYHGHHPPHGYDNLPAVGDGAGRDVLVASPLFTDHLALELPTEHVDGSGDRVEAVRAAVGRSLGIVVPDVHVAPVGGGEWRLLLHEEPIASGHDEPWLALESALEAHAGELLTYDGMVELLRWARQESPALVNAIVPNQFDVGSLRTIVTQLLRERVPVRPVSVLLGALVDVGRSGSTSDTAELVRPYLWRGLRRRLLQDDGRLAVLRFADGAVHGIASSISAANRGHRMRLPLDLDTALRDALDGGIAEHPELSPVVVACPTGARRWVSTWVRRHAPDTYVVGDEELARMGEVDTVATIGSGIVPVPPAGGDGRRTVEAFIEGSSYEGAWSGGGSGYLEMG